MKYSIYTIIVIFVFLGCKNKDTKPKAEILEGYWKIKKFTIDPPLFDVYSDFTDSLDVCSKNVTFYFRSDGTTTFVDVPEECKGDLEDINLNTEGISKWRFEDNLLIIYNDYSPVKDRYELTRPDNNTMVWVRKQLVAIPANLGGNQVFSFSLIFSRVTSR